MKYKDWLKDWLTNYVMPNYKNRTYERYTRIVEQHIITKLGEYELSELTPFLVRWFVTELTSHGNLRTCKGLASNTVNSIITVIQQSMFTAHSIGLVPVYEMNNVKRPKTQEKPVECFTPAEQKKIEQELQSMHFDKNRLLPLNKPDAVYDSLGTVHESCRMPFQNRVSYFRLSVEACQFSDSRRIFLLLGNPHRHGLSLRRTHASVRFRSYIFLQCQLEYQPPFLQQVYIYIIMCLSPLLIIILCFYCFKNSCI